jgi:hypothetical protein
MMIFVDALRHLGPDPTADQVRNYINHLHAWVGANGVFDFGAGDQGTWRSVSRPHGYLVK